MFCLRSWLPLLFIPTNASPIFIFLFFVCTYFLNRPCVYCSFLLLILFASSCHWSDHCFFDFSSNWFEPRSSSTSFSLADYSNQTLTNSSMSNQAMEQALIFMGAMNGTAKTLGGVALQELRRRVPIRPEWTGIGVGWLRSLLGRREWTLPYGIIWRLAGSLFFAWTVWGIDGDVYRVYKFAVYQDSTMH